jgi:hypothetical protein
VWTAPLELGSAADLALVVVPPSARQHVAHLVIHKGNFHPYPAYPFVAFSLPDLALVDIRGDSPGRSVGVLVADPRGDAIVEWREREAGEEAEDTRDDGDGDDEDVFDEDEVVAIRLRVLPWPLDSGLVPGED